MAGTPGARLKGEARQGKEGEACVAFPRTDRTGDKSQNQRPPTALIDGVHQSAGGARGANPGTRFFFTGYIS